MSHEAHKYASPSLAGHDRPDQAPDPDHGTEHMKTDLDHPAYGRAHRFTPFFGDETAHRLDVTS